MRWIGLIFGMLARGSGESFKKSYELQSDIFLASWVECQDSWDAEKVVFGRGFAVCIYA
jgi:hypothetical protein